MKQLLILAAASLVFLMPGATQASLLGHWNLDGNITDSSGNGLNGSMFGGVVATTDRFGTANAALQFDGTSGYATVADNVVMQVPTYSISAWFRWDDLGTNDVGFIVGRNFENYEIHTGGGSGVDGVRFIPSSLHYNDSPGTIEAGWNHVVATFDDSTNTSKVYVNSQLHTTFVSATATDVTGDLYFGGRSSLNLIYFFEGAIDDIRLYDRVLNQGDVDTLFDPNGASAVPEPATIAVWSALSLLSIGMVAFRKQRLDLPTVE